MSKTKRFVHVVNKRHHVRKKISSAPAEHRGRTFDRSVRQLLAANHRVNANVQHGIAAG